MGPMYPEVIVQHPERPDFEEALRELVRNMPYLGIALLVHLVVFFMFANVRIVLPVEDKGLVIAADRALAPVDIQPPVPVLQPVIEDLPLVIEDPEPTLTDDTPVDALVMAASSAPALGADAQLGVGVGPTLPGGGRGGLPGNTGGSGRKPHANILAGLEWLKHHQDPDGFWSASAFSDQCGRQGGDTICDGRGNPRFDVGVTGLALLAFLGAGSTDRWGEYQDVVKSGLRYLLDVQEADGLLGSRSSTQHTYDHAIATLAVCEAYAKSHTFQLKRPAVAALKHLESLRTPGSGWRYAADHPEMSDPTRGADTSVTGWAVLAMLAARKAELPVDEVAFEDALAFLDEMTDPATGRTGYISRGGPVAREAGTEVQWPDRLSEATTAVAVLCRVLADPDLQRPGAADLVAKGSALIAALPPVWTDDDAGRRDYYFWYYGAYALYQVGTRQQWKRWEDALFEVVMAQQHKAGELEGSWDPQHDPWGHLGGRVYSTALLTLLAEVYFRYPSLLAEGR